MTKATSSPTLLYGELDEKLLAAQTAAFEKAGYQVQPVVGREGVQGALKQGTFELVILGASLTRNDRHHLPYMVKKANAAIRVLVLHTDGSRHPYVDANTDTGSGTEELLRKLSELVPKAAAARAGR
jgi:DNA-binding NtrC family response regulator